MFAKNCVFALYCGLLLCVINEVGLASVGDAGVSVFFKNPPTQLKHCEPYTMGIEAKINNPKIQAELKKADVVWILNGQFEHSNAATSKCEVLFEPSNPIKETFDPTWTVFKYKRIAGLGKVGRGINRAFPPRDFERASYFKTSGKWKVVYTAIVSGPDNNDPTKSHKLTGSKYFNATISSPKLLVCAVEGLGGVMPGNDHLQNLLNNLSQENDYELEYQKFIEASNLNFISKLEDKIYHFAECGCNHIALIGYSYGGHEAIKIAGTLGNGYAPTLNPFPNRLPNLSSYKKRKIPINLLFTIDPVKQVDLNPNDLQTFPRGNYDFTKPGNVSNAINFYQQVDDRSINIIGFGLIDVYGDSVAGAANTQFHKADFNIPQAHVAITRLPAVLDTLKKSLEEAKPK